MSVYPLRAVVVCVDYADLLAVTLPWNRHHFEEVMVVTSPKDQATRGLLNRLCDDQIQGLYTDEFYKRGATFNKWAALERGLDVFGRRGWLCLLDADVLWPKQIHLPLTPGRLYGPLRRMMPIPNPPRTWTTATHNHPFPPEGEWWQYPIHRNVGEWAGYAQIFHAEDPVLGPAPWHEVNWKHAGGADSFFQQKWPLLHRVRPGWEVLHLGDAGANWMGRSTPLLSGQTLPEAAQRQAAMQALWSARRGRQGPDRFDQEKL